MVDPGPVSIATFMLLLDITVVNVALPDIQRDLDASLSSLQWVVDAYALTLAAVPAHRRLARRPARPPAGVQLRLRRLHLRLVPLRDRRRPDPAQPRPRRCRASAAAAMFATSLALIAPGVPGHASAATAIGVWGATVGGAVAIGPLVGGVITEHLGWEWIFFVNVPIGIAAIVLTERKLANVAATGPRADRLARPRHLLARRSSCSSSG